MNSTDRDLKNLIDRHLKWPSDLSFTAARGRVREQLFATPAYRQTARVADAPSSIPMWRMAAAAAVVVIVVIGTAIFWPRGVQAYSAGDDGLQVTLADNSSVEMRAHSEMTVGRAADGIQIDLKTGDIIVTAAEQHDGHLYVRTKDMTVAVDGTVFLVNASQDGSRVGVIEGEVRVREGGRETRLRPGEQVATSSAIVARPLTEDINWSRNATAHLAILDSSM
jgi:ferric-dicitrate binding protein FerR (iron transport regulator)